MIITKLNGGLGNQMFQYACGRALALRNNDTLKLDISGYSRQHPGDAFRTYSLSHFSIEETITGESEATKARYPLGSISKYAEMFRKKIMRQFNVGFIPRIMRMKTTGKNVYLDGFWQSENYFADCADDIRREFTLKKPLDPTAQKIAGEIAAGPSVSIHIRRGDIVNDGGKSGLFGIATPEYYSHALVCLAEKLSAHHIKGIKNFRVFVFSDDMEWTKKNIVIPYPTTYVLGNDAKTNLPDYEEMTLMSMCDHNIIANSSFSWWGAWLNKNPEKIVIAPARWSTSREKWHTDTVPTSWTRL
jgi:hypothetical protein